jgi:hypothetical protein
MSGFSDGRFRWQMVLVAGGFSDGFARFNIELAAGGFVADEGYFKDIVAGGQAV